MKRSEINRLTQSATACFQAHGWTLPPKPRWDATDFGLGNATRFGLVLINLAEHAEYCEKLMFARNGMETPAHCHHQKKEDIICRWGSLRIQVWPGKPGEAMPSTLELLINQEAKIVNAGDFIDLNSGERVTLVPRVYHAFYPLSEECIIGEVSTYNDDQNDNFFINEDVGRFPEIEEDEPALLRLVSDR